MKINIHGVEHDFVISQKISESIKEGVSMLCYPQGKKGRYLLLEAKCSYCNLKYDWIN